MQIALIGELRMLQQSTVRAGATARSTLNQHRACGSVVRKWARLRHLTAHQWVVLVAALFMLPAIEIALRLRGMQRVATRLARWSDGAVVARDPSLPAQLAEPIAIVAGRPVVGARCLGRSLTLWFVLRRRGIDAELVLGTLAPTDDDLPAHAWVEVDGVPVNDDPDVRERYGSFGLRLPRLGESGARG